MWLMQTSVKLVVWARAVGGGKLVGQLGLGESLNVWLFLSSHYFSLLCQGPQGIEVMGDKVFWSVQKASCAGLRERKEVKE